MAADSKISVAIGAEDRELVQALAGASQSIRQFSEQTVQQFDKLKSGINTTTFTAALRPALDALAGLKNKIMETADAAVSWNREVNGLARTMGVTTVEAGGLAKALGRLGTDTDTYRNAAFALQRSLNTQERALNANGIATRNAKGEMLNIQQVMMNALDRLREMEPGYNANALAMLAFGRQAKELGGILKLTSEGIERGTRRRRRSSPSGADGQLGRLWGLGRRGATEAVRSIWP